jgi:hypothetical protein
MGIENQVAVAAKPVAEKSQKELNAELLAKLPAAPKKSVANNQMIIAGKPSDKYKPVNGIKARIQQLHKAGYTLNQKSHSEYTFCFSCFPKADNPDAGKYNRPRWYKFELSKNGEAANLHGKKSKYHYICSCGNNIC